MMQQQRWWQLQATRSQSPSRQHPLSRQRLPTRSARPHRAGPPPLQPTRPQRPPAGVSAGATVPSAPSPRQSASSTTRCTYAQPGTAERQARRQVVLDCNVQGRRVAGRRVEGVWLTMEWRCVEQMVRSVLQVQCTAADTPAPAVRGVGICGMAAVTVRSSLSSCAATIARPTMRRRTRVDTPSIQASGSPVQTLMSLIAVSTTCREAQSQRANRSGRLCNGQCSLLERRRAGCHAASQ